MATRYARETGRNWPRFNKPTDPQSIHGLALVRRSRPGSVARLTYYPSIRAKAFRPTLGALVRAERRIEANRFARSSIAANSSMPLDLQAYAARLFGMAA